MSTTTIPTGGGDPATRPRTPAAGGAPAAGRRRAYAGERSLRNGVVALIVIFNAVLLVYPIVQALLGSFHQWNPLNGTYRWVGLENYSDLAAERIQKREQLPNVRNCSLRCLLSVVC